MSDDALTKMRDFVQDDVGKRGLRTLSRGNLIDAFPDDFARACQSLAETPNAGLAIFTGFLIPSAQPPSAETDGPLGAIFLARALAPLGIRVALVTDWFCQRALEVGLEAVGLDQTVFVQTLPPPSQAWIGYVPGNWKVFAGEFGLTHMLALEKAGPNHFTQSFQAQFRGAEIPKDIFQSFLHECPDVAQNRCYTMKGLDITDTISPAHRLFETTKQTLPGVTTIGIGDGGNEIGMGKIPWYTIRRNIQGGGRIACRVPTDLLIVSGVSNWGAYGLAAGVRYLRKEWPAPDLFDPRTEIRLLKAMVNEGPLVDGITGKQTLTVDGLAWDRYSNVLKQLAAIT